MRNPRMISAAAFLKSKGFDVPIEILEEMFNVTKGLPIEAYDIGDFVQFYQGMGESWFGVVTKIAPLNRGYRIRQWTTDDSVGLECYVTDTDMRGLATLEQAEEYNRIRSGLA